ncbi:hypothetical protein ACIPUC_07485 [Streptomyces sp. LARHCF249]
MAHLTFARIASGAALAIAVGLASAPAAQAAPPTGRPSASPLSVDNLLSLRFLTPTVRDAKRQITGLASGLSPAPANAVGLGQLLK